MRDALEPTQGPDWILSHEGYNVLTERAARMPKNPLPKAKRDSMPLSVSTL